MAQHTGGTLTEDSIIQLQCGTLDKQPVDPRTMCRVSLINLIAHPQRYHGRRVQVEGYIKLEFEGDAVYLHEEDRRNSLTKNSLWLHFPSLRERPPQELAEGYALVEGTFDATVLGHLSLFSGAIRDITRISGAREWGPGAPAEPFEPKDPTTTR